MLQLRVFPEEIKFPYDVFGHAVIRSWPSSIRAVHAWPMLVVRPVNIVPYHRDVAHEQRSNLIVAR